MLENIKKGLQNKPTCTQCVVLGLYRQLVDIPYMVEAWKEDKNFLDMEEFHTHVIEYCRAIATDPELALTADKTSYPTTLDAAPMAAPQGVLGNHAAAR
jgi:hypothetical protein